MKVENPRFPHSCKIYRKVEETEFDDGKELVVYCGECRVYNKRYSKSVTSGVQQTERRVNIPNKVIGIEYGDLIDATDYVGCKTYKLADFNVGNLGTTISLDKYE